MSDDHDHPTDVEVQKIITIAKASAVSWDPATVLNLARALLAAREKVRELERRLILSGAHLGYVNWRCADCPSRGQVFAKDFEMPFQCSHCGSEVTDFISL